MGGNARIEGIKLHSNSRDFGLVRWVSRTWSHPWRWPFVCVLSGVLHFIIKTAWLLGAYPLNLCALNWRISLHICVYLSGVVRACISALRQPGYWVPTLQTSSNLPGKTLRESNSNRWFSMRNSGLCRLLVNLPPKLFSRILHNFRIFSKKCFSCVGYKAIPNWGC